MRLAQSQRDITEVPDTESHGIQVDRVVGHTGGAEVLGVGLEKGEGGLLGGGEGLGALLADGEHVGVDVGDGDADIWVVVEVVGVGEVAEGDVACAACYVEDVLGGWL